MIKIASCRSPSILQKYRCRPFHWSTGRSTPSSRRSATASAASPASFQWRPRSGPRTRRRPRRSALPASLPRHRLEGTNDRRAPVPRRPLGPHATCNNASSTPASANPRPLPSSNDQTTPDGPRGRGHISQLLAFTKTDEYRSAVE